MFNYYTSGIGPTPDEQTYIGFLDETIRSVQKGGQNLGYSVLDLAYTIPDFAFGTTLQERLLDVTERGMKNALNKTFTANFFCTFKYLFSIFIIYTLYKIWLNFFSSISYYSICVSNIN